MKRIRLTLEVDLVVEWISTLERVARAHRELLETEGLEPDTVPDDLQKITLRLAKALGHSGRILHPP